MILLENLRALNIQADESVNRKKTAKINGMAGIFPIAKAIFLFFQDGF